MSMRTFAKIVATALAVVALVILVNWWSVGSPVSAALEEDPRNGGIQLRAHHEYYITPSVLILDLRDAEQVTPADLGRVLFQAAGGLHKRSFNRVVLARQRQPVFLIDGPDFQDIGSQFAAGQNPLYLVRKLPSKLYRPDGKAAFGSWSGGLLGVVGEEMQDYNEAMTLWATGR